MTIPDVTPTTILRPPALPRSDESARRAASLALEAAFLAEMLKHTGLGDAPDSFGGGIGEAQFSSMLRDLQARSMAEHRGIGLAESIFKALGQREDG